ncbi:hypothetical protein N8652_00800 [bacterium]|nr:hypothetical protein [bacterium]
MVFSHKLAYFIAIGGMAIGLFASRSLWSPSVVDPGPPPDFIRFVENERTGELQTAISTYRSSRGVTVALIGAVHVADKVYYETLNARFSEYDAVLYELVGDPEALFSQETEASPSMLRMFQQSLVGVLNLHFQLDGIDYTTPHFVHADFTKEEFEERQKARGESILTFIMKAVSAQAVGKEGQARGQQVDPWQLMRAVFSKDRSNRLKLIVARQFDKADEMFALMEGEEGSVIITERNERAIGVLEEQIAAGKRNLAIFYGAGHLLDLDQRLIDRKFRRSGHEWLTAWMVTKPK